MISAYASHPANHCLTGTTSMNPSLRQATDDNNLLSSIENVSSGNGLRPHCGLVARGANILYQNSANSVSLGEVCPPPKPKRLHQVVVLPLEKRTEVKSNVHGSHETTALVSKNKENAETLKKIVNNQPQRRQHSKNWKGDSFWKTMLITGVAVLMLLPVFGVILYSIFKTRAQSNTPGATHPARRHRFTPFRD